MAQRFTNQGPKLDIPGAKTETPVIDGWDRTDEDNSKLARDWKSNIELTERRNEVWEKRGERIIKRYRDERGGGVNAGTGGANVDTPRRMNILWSNVQVLKPSIYGREPLPIAERRFLDQRHDQRRRPEQRFQLERHGGR